MMLNDFTICYLSTSFFFPPTNVYYPTPEQFAQHCPRASGNLCLDSVYGYLVGRV